MMQLKQIEIESSNELHDRREGISQYNLTCLNHNQKIGDDQDCDNLCDRRIEMSS